MTSETEKQPDEAEANTKVPSVNLEEMNVTVEEVEEDSPRAPVTMDDILARKKPNLESAEIQLDPDIARAIEDLQAKLIEARRADRRAESGKSGTGFDYRSQVDDIQAKIDELIEEGKASEQEFLFRSIGAKSYDNLIADYPPTPSQKKAGKQVDVDKFVPALISAASYEPKITLEQATQIYESEDWSQGEVNKMFLAAQAANETTRDIPLSNSASGRIGDFDLSSIIQQLRESPTQSS